MSLSDLASIGSFISSFAVVVTLGFLLLQLRQSNRNQRSLIQQARAERTMAALREFASPHFSAVVGKFSERKEMTAAEINILLRTISGYFMSVEDSYLQFRAGTLDGPSWNADRETLTKLLQQPFTRAAWKMVRHYFAGDYLHFVDDILSRTDAVVPGNLLEAWNAAYNEELQKALPSTDSPARAGSLL